MWGGGGGWDEGKAKEERPWERFWGSTFECMLFTYVVKYGFLDSFIIKMYI